MLYYNRADVSEGIGDNKSSKSYNCIICNYYYFLKVNFRFQLRVSAIVSVKRNDDRIYFWYMSKGEVINRMNGAEFRETST